MIIFFERHRGLFVILGGFLVQLTIGNLYTSKSITLAITAYMNNCSWSKNVSEKSNSLIYSLMFFGLGASFSLGGFIESKIGPSLTVLIGGWFMSINICLMYFTLKSSVSIVAISYGLFVGIGSGIAYGSTFRSACTWYPKRKGLIIGLVVSGLGLSPSIFNSLQIYIKNSHISNSSCCNDRLQLSFVIIGLIFLVLQFIGSILIKNKPGENDKFNAQTMSCQDEELRIFSSRDYRNIELWSYQLLFEFDFWILWLIFFTNQTTVILITLFPSEYASKKLLISNDALFNIFIVNRVLNFAGRIFWGYLIDIKPFKDIMIIITASTSVFVGTLIALQLIKDMNIKLYTFGFWMAVINFFESGCVSVLPAVCANLFGMKNLISNYGMIFTACTFSSTIITIASQYFLESQDYITIFLIVCGVSVFGAGITLFFRGKSLIVR